jgi:hypothetical protein
MGTLPYHGAPLPKQMFSDEKHVYQHTNWYRFRLLVTSIRIALELLIAIIGTDYSTIQFFVPPITVSRILALGNVSGRAFCGKIWLYFWTQGKKKSVVHPKRKRVHEE